MTLPLVFTLVFIFIIAGFLLRDVRQGAQFVNQREELTLWLRLQQETNMFKGIKLEWDAAALPKKAPAYLQWNTCDVLAVPEGILLFINWQHTPAEVIYLYQQETDAEKYPGVRWNFCYKSDERLAESRVIRITFTDADEAKANSVTLHFP